jgi:hypothetical protein
MKLDYNTIMLLIVLSVMIFIIIFCSCILSKLTMGTFCCKKQVFTIDDEGNYNVNV